MSITVVELNGLDPSEVIVISSKLRITGRGGERRL